MHSMDHPLTPILSAEDDSVDEDLGFNMDEGQSTLRTRYMPLLKDIQIKDAELAKVRHIANKISKKRRMDAMSELELEEESDTEVEEDDATVHTSHFAGLFHRVICDEGHKLKNCRTQNSVAVDKLYCPKKWIVTATPMIN